MLQTIEAKLSAIAEPVFYGTADEIKNGGLWNYIVFFRDKLSRNDGNTGYTDFYTVGVVHENWVPDELISDVIDAIESIPGMRLARADIDFNYTRKPGTNAVVEIASIPFCRSRKKV